MWGFIAGRCQPFVEQCLQHCEQRASSDSRHRDDLGNVPRVIGRQHEHEPLRHPFRPPSVGIRLRSPYPLGWALLPRSSPCRKSAKAASISICPVVPKRRATAFKFRDEGVLIANSHLRTVSGSTEKSLARPSWVSPALRRRLRISLPRLRAIGLRRRALGGTPSPKPAPIDSGKSHILRSIRRVPDGGTRAITHRKGRARTKVVSAGTLATGLSRVRNKRGCVTEYST